jgi:O-antigen/teichoic acid export membrane protein
MNKVVLAALNGMSHMISYAILVAARATFIFTAILVSGLTGLSIDQVPWVFGAAEFVTLAVGVVLLKPRIVGLSGRLLRYTGRVVLGFGMRSLPSGLIAEVNSRVDVLVLGVFVSDAVIGNYAFAALLAEGFYGLAIVLRTVMSPRIAGALAAGRAAELAVSLRRNAPYLTGGFVALLIVSAVVLAVLFNLVPLDMDGYAVILYFLLIGSGVALTAALIPYSTILMLGGRPGAHSLLFLGTVLFNFVGNIVLVPVIGPIGAAVSTGSSFVFSAVATLYLSKALLGVNLIR